MVEHAHVHQRQCLLQRISEQAVRLARLGHAGRMVVSEDGGCRIERQRAFNYFTRIHAGLGERAMEQLLRRDHPVLCVEEDDHEHLLLTPAQQQLQILAHRAWRVQGIASFHFLMQGAPRHLQHRLQLHKLGLPHAMYRTKLLLAYCEQLREAAEAGEQLARQVYRALTCDTRAQKYRQQFCIGQRRRAALQQLLARAFPFRPVRDRHGKHFLVKMQSIMEQAQQKRIVPVNRIILGITGGIAAYKAAELVRLLQKQGVDVQVVMTEAACHFITPLTLQALSGKPVLTDQWNSTSSGGEGNGMAHISASRAADAIVVAPASADFIAKLAQGLADDLLSTLCLARDCPLLVAPAMNRQMWENAATQRNVQQLQADGVALLGPGSGAQACGEEGMGRMLEAEELARDILAHLQPGTLSGVNVLITAGPTYEAIDAVRGITNRSSGKMGYAIARAARELGAQVTLVSGPVTLSTPQGVSRADVVSAAEMLQAVQQHVATADIFISVAAVADYRAAQPSAQKIKKTADKMTLELQPTTDILAQVAGLPKPPFCVGFAAESEDLRKHASAKRKAKKIPLLAANLAQHAIGADASELILFDDAGEHVLPHADKLTLARQLIQHIVRLRKI